MRNIRMSAEAEHSIQLHYTVILSTKPRNRDCIFREVTEIKPHPNNVNREDGLSLSKSCKPLIYSLKDGMNCRPGLGAT
jgi:hypothetical protein